MAQKPNTRCGVLLYLEREITLASNPAAYMRWSKSMCDLAFFDSATTRWISRNEGKGSVFGWSRLAILPSQATRTSKRA
jgi:hypothetical protein